nr:E3 ubiquitin-protein ligase RFWD3-like [Drosophila takahashii]
MDEKQLLKMLKRDIIAEVEVERAQNAPKLELINEKLQQEMLRKEVHTMRTKNEEMRQKLALQDRDLKPFIDMEKRKLLDKLDEIADENKCCLCALKFESGGSHRRVILKCGHIFGQNCICTYLKADKKCPVCDSLAYLCDPRVIITGEILYTPLSN